MSGSGNGLPHRGNDLLSPTGQHGSGSSIRDTRGDHQRQLEIANKIFTALKSAGWWRAVYIDDMQKVLDSYDPAQ